METLAGVGRLLFGFVGMIGLVGLWMLGFVVIMAVTLYTLKLFPLAGQRRKR